MKKPLLLALLAGALFTSCLKDGFNDFDALKHPMTFQGTVSPTLGVPIGMGSATLYDMLQMVQLSDAKMEVGANGIITILYDTTAFWNIQLDNNKKTPKSGAKDGTIVHVARNTTQGSIAIDLFNNIGALNDAELEVDSLKVYFKTHLLAHAREGAVDSMAKYHVHVYYDQLTLYVVGKDNTVQQVLAINDSIPIDSLLAGQDVILFNDEDISGAVNMRPKELRYSARMNIAFEAAFFASAGISENQFVADSIGITSVDVTGDIKVRFPISAYINDLNYDAQIDFSPSFQLGQLSIDTSMIYLECNNSIPLSLLLRAQLLDSTDAPLCDLLDPILTEVAGADVAINPVTNLYSSVGPNRTLVQIPVTAPVFDALLKTKKIQLTATLNTTTTGDPIRNRVAVQASDKLDLRVWAKLTPSYNLDIDINTGNTEGGAE
jgi:hypothetical protein